MISDTDSYSPPDHNVLSVQLEVDATGLRCPLPLLKAKQALNGLQTGDKVKITATDSGSVRDFHAFADLSGHRVVRFTQCDGVYEYVLQKR